MQNRSDDRGDCVRDAHEESRDEAVQHAHDQAGNERRQDHDHQSLILKETLMRQEQARGEAKLQGHQPAKRDGRLRLGKIRETRKISNCPENWRE